MKVFKVSKYLGFHHQLIFWLFLCITISTKAQEVNNNEVIGEWVMFYKSLPDRGKGSTYPSNYTFISLKADGNFTSNFLSKNEINGRWHMQGDSLFLKSKNDLNLMLTRKKEKGNQILVYSQFTQYSMGTTHYKFRKK